MTTAEPEEYQYGVRTKWGTAWEYSKEGAERQLQWHRRFGDEATLMRRRPAMQAGPWEPVPDDEGGS